MPGNFSFTNRAHVYKSEAGPANVPDCKDAIYPCQDLEPL